MVEMRGQPARLNALWSRRVQEGEVQRKISTAWTCQSPKALIGFRTPMLDDL